MKHSKTAILLLATCLTTPAFAQDASPPAAAETVDNGAAIIVTGSRIKQDPAKSALPLQIISTDDLTREGINSPEQLISYLSTNGNGADNLASNADVTSGAQRGTNGLSAANLRGQGSASTLVCSTDAASSSRHRAERASRRACAHPGEGAFSM